MTAESQTSKDSGETKVSEEGTLNRLTESFSPQQWSLLLALDPNFLISALQSFRPAVLPNESRRAARRRVFLGAKIVFNGRTSVVDCQISDISATGCRLKVQGSSYIPSHFTLNFTASNTFRECEIAWRNEAVMGVLFLGARPPV